MFSDHWENLHPLKPDLRPTMGLLTEDSAETGNRRVRYAKRMDIGIVEEYKVCLVCLKGEKGKLKE